MKKLDSGMIAPYWLTALGLDELTFSPSSSHRRPFQDRSIGSEVRGGCTISGKCSNICVMQPTKGYLTDPAGRIGLEVHPGSLGVYFAIYCRVMIS